MSWLYRYEAKSIQRWILATDRLVELEGGSTAIEQLAPAAAEAIRSVRGEFLYGAAGSATATFPDREALEGFARWWPVWVSRHAPGLEVVQAWVQATGDGEDLAKLRAQLGAVRNQRHADLPEAGPWVARAGRSGLPAVGRDDDRGLEDRGTRARRRAGEAQDLLAEKLLDPNALGKWVDVQGPIAFERDLSRYDDDEGLAVVHADGNGLGQAIHKMDLQRLREFSEALSVAATRSAQRAIAGLLQAERGDRNLLSDGEERLRGRPIVSGGDDFTFIVRGRYGVTLAEAWLRAFEEETRKRPCKELTACAGVVFVRTGFPFHQAHELSEKLCKAAKSRFKAEHSTSTRSHLAFARVTTSLHEVDEDQPSWSLPDLRRLDTLVSAMSALGVRGKIREWVAERDGKRAADHWKRLAQVAREDDAVRWQAFEAALAPFEPRRRDALRSALQWSRIHPGITTNRLWGNP